MSTEDVARAEFEAAYLTYIQNKMGGPIPEGVLKEYVERNSDGEYRSFHAAGAWWGWQASREALAVKLPVNYGWDGYPDGPLLKSDEVKAAIEAAGVRVRP